MEMPCMTCDGKGDITDQHAARISRGKQFRDYRVSHLRLGLRQAAYVFGMSLVELSNIEQGKTETTWTPPGWKET